MVKSEGMLPDFEIRDCTHARYGRQKKPTRLWLLFSQTMKTFTLLMLFTQTPQKGSAQLKQVK